MNTFTAPWFLNYKVLNICYIISFRFTNFQNIVFEFASFIGLKPIWNIMYNDSFLGVKMVSALLSFNRITHPYFAKWSTIAKIFLKSIPNKVWKKNCVSLVSVSWLIRFNMFYYCIFLNLEKRRFIQFFFFMKPSLCFWKSSESNFFLKIKCIIYLLFIHDFKSNFNPNMLLTL